MLFGLRHGKDMDLGCLKRGIEGFLERLTEAGRGLLDIQDDNVDEEVEEDILRFCD